MLPDIAIPIFHIYRAAFVRISNTPQNVVEFLVQKVILRTSHKKNRFFLAGNYIKLEVNHIFLYQCEREK
jgi:hypothetical protein